MSEVADDEVERCRERVGTIIRKAWRIDALLGVGGMAAVYAVTHQDGRRAAIKILHPEVAFSRELRLRFEQEAHAIAQLGHPGTVHIIDLGMTDDGAPYMVMELLDGESLGQMAYRLDGSIPERDLLVYADAVLDVLGAAHARGIIHRDVKPDNLFITTEGRLKVLDFGIARMKEGGSVKTRTGAMLGTTAYMAPEQIHAKPVDGRADIYALGATMFRVLAKRKIHETDTDAELIMKMGSTPAPALLTVAPHVNTHVAMIVDRSLQFDRDKRYPDAATMQGDVRAVLRRERPPFACAPVKAVEGVPTMAGPIPTPPVASGAPTMGPPPPSSAKTIPERTPVMARPAPSAKTIGMAAAELHDKNGYAADRTWRDTKLEGDRRRSVVLLAVGAAIAVITAVVAGLAVTQCTGGGGSERQTANAAEREDIQSNQPVTTAMAPATTSPPDGPRQDPPSSATSVSSSPPGSASTSTKISKPEVPIVIPPASSSTPWLIPIPQPDNGDWNEGRDEIREPKPGKHKPPRDKEKDKEKGSKGR